MSGRPVIFGEVLFDRFPDGRTVLGGAPFNVARHLAAFGQSPMLVSRVGDDALGRQLLDTLTTLGMDRGGVGVDDRLATGTVEVTFEQGEPVYAIEHPVAWDAIAVPPWPDDAAMLYHGSLALRDPVSRSALQALREQAGGNVFVDVNLRDPWWSPDRLEDLLAGTRWLKLNADELSLLDQGREGTLSSRAAAFAARHELEGLLLTLGPGGALAVEAGGRVTLSDPPPAVQVVDTVGAGDAFASVFALGRLQGWPLPLTLTRALAFAAAVCTLRGATPADAGFYAPFLHDWTR